MPSQQAFMLTDKSYAVAGVEQSLCTVFTTTHQLRAI